MNIIMVGSNGRPSMRMLSNVMKEPCKVYMRGKFFNGGRRWFEWSNSRDDWVRIPGVGVGEMPNLAGCKVIRWGYSGEIGTRCGVSIIYQKAKAIDLISNKAKARFVMRDNGVPIPATSNNCGDLLFPVIARPFYHHGGKDFHVCNNDEESSCFNIGHYFSELYPKTAEYRVHCGHGKVLIVEEKPLVDGCVQANHAVTKKKWRVLRWGEYDNDVCRISLDAVRAVGADMGGVDIMTCKDHETPVVVCEINSAPTLADSQYSLSRYSEYFDWLFRCDTRRDWYDYCGWKHGDSFAFKHKQLEN